MKIVIFLLCSVLVFIDSVSGHGYVINPVGRASRWRVDNRAPVNWDDDQLYCGSFGNHWNVNGGRCGFCGDDFRNPTPRPHEHGGRFGQGVIVANYPSGSVLPVQVQLTVNHVGHFEFSLCNMDGGGESENCFNRNQLRTTSGQDRVPVPPGFTGAFNVQLRLPAGLTCRHCVLRWIYVAGNNWGCCDDGRCGMGCGPQEHFRACSDISITSNRFNAIDPIVNVVEDVPADVPVENQDLI